LLEINDVALDGRISFLWWSWVCRVGDDGRSTRVLTSIGNLKEAVHSEQAGGLGISVHVVSITDVECGDSMWLSGVAVMAVVEYMTVGGSLQEGVTEGSDNFLETGGGDFTGVTGANRYSKVISLGRPPVTTFLTGEKSRASPEGSARKTVLCGFSLRAFS